MKICFLHNHIVFTEFLIKFVCDLCCSLFEYLTMALDERFTALEETMLNLVQVLANVGLLPHHPQNRPPQNHRQPEDRNIRVDIPEFDGYSHDPSSYLEWEERMD